MNETFGKMNSKSINSIIPTLILVLLVQVVAGQNQPISVMPYPKSVEMNDGRLKITRAFRIHVFADSSDKVIEKAANKLLLRLSKRTLGFFRQKQVDLQQHYDHYTLTIKVKEKAEVQINIDESYELDITSDSMTLIANNTIGALRGIETISQLVYVDDNGYYLPAVRIKDSPLFKWRGSMIDAARHFISLEVIKRHIDAMAVVKMNVLHLHLTDDEGFRVECKTFPKLHEHGSNGQFYTQEELKDIVNYASERGIMVYPEFDLPSHSQSWFAGYPELASSPGSYEPGTRFKLLAEEMKGGASVVEAMRQAPFAAFNPAKEEVYEFLDKFIGEMSFIFPSPYLHIGVDENNGAVWKNNPQIVQFMADNEIENVASLQAYFVNRLYPILKKYNKTMVAWEEVYTPSIFEDIVVQLYREKEPGAKPPINIDEVTDKGNSVIVSTGFYLDLLFPAYVHYENLYLHSNLNEKILGGEAPLWSEFIDENCFENRAWPRTAVVAERLWSPQNVNDVNDMYRRLFILEDRLEAAGLSHRLNTIRMLSELNNGKDLQPLLTVLQPLATLRGRKIAKVGVTYGTSPLVGLPFILGCDSKKAWEFRKLVQTYLDSKDSSVKSEIKDQLVIWKEAALKVNHQYANAPNLRGLHSMSLKIVKATDIGLQAIRGNIGEDEINEKLGELKSLSENGEAEIIILNEIESLLTGVMYPLKSFNFYE
jgi:hexosaminidase